MLLHVHATGSHFEDDSDLQSTLEMLFAYKEAFGWCVEKSSAVNGITAVSERPRLKVRAIRAGSLDIDLALQSVIATAGAVPQIFGYAWELYGAASQLIEIVTGFFNNTGRPMTIHIQESPGATVNVVNGDQVNVTNDALHAAQSTHPAFDKIAKLVKDGRADRIRTSFTDSHDIRPVEIHHNNANRFKVGTEMVTDDDSSEVLCDIFRFNKKTLVGQLEFFPDGEPRTCSFKANEHIVDDCITALRQTRTRISARKQFETNALGETKIKKFFIDDILPFVSEE